MKQTTKEEFQYDTDDVKRLIYEDIVKRLGPINKARVVTNFCLCVDPKDTDDRGPTQYIFDKAYVIVDTTK